MNRGRTGVHHAASRSHQEALELLSADVRLVVGDVTVEGEAPFHQGHRDHGHRDHVTEVIAEVTLLPVGL